MKTKKKVIRLTENDLHNMNSEAVKVALNELDPRTYASAAEKARMKGDFERTKKFKKAATDSWDNEYGNEVGASNFIDVRDYDGSESLNNGECYVLNNYDDNSGDTYDLYHSKERRTLMPWNKRRGNQEAYFDNPMTKGENVASQMVYGDGEYIKGKGWK